MNGMNIQPEKVIDYIYDNKLKFALSLIVVFFITFTVLSVAGFIPEELDTTPQDEVKSGLIQQNKNEAIVKGGEQLELSGELPVRILIDKIGVNTAIYNPESSKISVLDDYLKKGAVRYPGSGLLGKGNMFLFGHSTGIRVVNNQAYKAFNKLGTLEVGDEIRVQSDGKEYLYKTISVVLVDEDKALVDFRITKPMLTISTCNTFGEKQERFVVQADLVGVKPLN